MLFLVRELVKILEQMANSRRGKKKADPEGSAFASSKNFERSYRAIISICTLCITQTVPTIRTSDMRMV